MKAKLYNLLSAIFIGRGCGVVLELNEAGLIEGELTLRKLRLTKEVLETKRSALRWLALSLGIINPGESRLSAVAALDALLNFQFIKGEDPRVPDLLAYIENRWEPMNEKTLRYHLLRMKRMGLIDNSDGRYYFRRSSASSVSGEPWDFGVFQNYYKDVFDNIKEVLREIKNTS